MSRRTVILDRDGVINEDSPGFIKSPAEWRPLPGSLEAIARLTAAGFDVYVASNQSGVGRGLFDAATLEAIHEKMRQAVEAAGGRLAGIYVCPHHPDAGCECRKPRPGLLRALAREHGLGLAGVPVVGDSRRDLEAAAAVGAEPWLVRTGNGRAVEHDGVPCGVHVVDDLAAAAAALIREA
jgi:D-glycero-D-manno-heptose 1,7-bisphosphate phosphatase